LRRTVGRSAEVRVSPTTRVMRSSNPPEHVRAHRVTTPRRVPPHSGSKIRLFPDGQFSTVLRAGRPKQSVLAEGGQCQTWAKNRIRFAAPGGKRIRIGASRHTMPALASSGVMNRRCVWQR
jgi:hypothetical protein